MKNNKVFLKVKEDVYNFLKEHALGGRYEGLQKELVKYTKSNSPYVRKALESLVEDNKIKTIQTFAESRESYIWEITDELNVSMRQENIVSVKNVKNKEDNIVDLKNYTIEQFDDFNLKIYNTKKGLAIQVIDIVAVLKTNRQNIYQTLDYNRELFEPFMVKEKIGNNILNNERLFLTKDGLIGLLMKVSYNRLSDEKKKLVLSFQRWAIEKLSTLVNKGKVELTDIEQAKIQDNIKETLELKEDDIDKLFNDLEGEVINKINMMKNKTKEYKDKMENTKIENNTLRSINNKCRINVMQLMIRSEI